MQRPSLAGVELELAQWLLCFSGVLLVPPEPHPSRDVKSGIWATSSASLARAVSFCSRDGVCL